MTMHFTQRNLKQDVTYWAPSGQNDYGQMTWAAPVLLRGRWEGKLQQVRRPNGEEVTSSTQVFVSADVVVDGFLALGDFVAEAAPVADARQIQSYSTNPDLRALGTERLAFL